MSEAKCPQCGKIVRDLYECGGEGTYEITCGHCEASLILTVRVSVDYELRQSREGQGGGK